jgi:hypothetical protein
MLDWEHIGRNFKHVERTLTAETKPLLERASWKLWHGLFHECIEKLERIDGKYFNGENKNLINLISYIQNCKEKLINYGEYKNLELPYTSNVIESAVGTIINSRQKDNKRMLLTRKGAHNILQIRCSIASKTWERD